MAEFILLLHESPESMAGIGPAELQAIIGRYKTWRDEVAKKGHLKGGHKLCDGTGRIMRSAGGKLAVTDGPFAEAKEILAGMFIIQAEDFEQAVSIAGDCPHLEYGTIEIRQIERV